MDFVELIRDFGVGKKFKHDNDSFVDRINHRYTVVVICCFCLLVSASQYGGNPIACWFILNILFFYQENYDFSSFIS